jgi:hypothetical protein
MAAVSPPNENLEGGRVLNPVATDTNADRHREVPGVKVITSEASEPCNVLSDDQPDAPAATPSRTDPARSYPQAEQAYRRALCGAQNLPSCDVIPPPVRCDDELSARCRNDARLPAAAARIQAVTVGHIDHFRWMRLNSPGGLEIDHSLGIRTSGGGFTCMATSADPR